MDFGIFTATLTDRELGRLLTEIRLLIEETQQASEQRVKAAQQDASAWQQRCKRVEDEYAASNDHMTAQQNFGIFV